MQTPRRSKATAAVLAIVLGSFGAHHFYLGNTKRALLYLVFCWTWIPFFFGIAEGIKYLATSNHSWSAKFDGLPAAKTPTPEGTRPPAIVLSSLSTQAARVLTAPAVFRRKVNRDFHTATDDLIAMVSVRRPRETVAAVGVLALLMLLFSRGLLIVLGIALVIFIVFVQLLPAPLEAIPVSKRRSLQIASVAAYAVLAFFAISATKDTLIRTMALRQADDEFNRQEYQAAAESYRRALDSGADSFSTGSLVSLAEGAHLAKEGTDALAREEFEVARDLFGRAEESIATLNSQHIPAPQLEVLDTLRVDVGAQTYFAVGMIAVNDQRFDVAIREFEQAIARKDQPEYQAALIEGRHLLEQQQVAESKAHYDAAIASLGLDDYANAIDEFEQVTEVDVERFADVQGKLAETKRTWAAALVVESQNAIDGGDYGKAMAKAREAMELDAELVSAKDLLAQASDLDAEAKRAAEAKRREAEAQAQQAKLEDAAYLYEENWIQGTAACEPVIESLALYDHEWTDGWLGQKFPRYLTNVKATGVVTLVGDTLKLQNGFGAWRNVVYWCDYDVVNEVVVDAGAE